MSEVQSPTVPAPAAKVSSETIEENIASRVFFVVEGTTLMYVHDGAPVPPLLYSDEAMLLHRARVMLEPALPESVEKPIYPFRSLHVNVEVAYSMGTIDELTTAYRNRLIGAYNKLLTGTALPAMADPAKSVAQAKQLGYEPGKALMRPFVEPHHPLRLEVAKRKLAHFDAVQEDVKARTAAQIVTE